MYTIIDSPSMMTKEEIDNAFDGKWVYIVKANIDRHGWLIEGMPVVSGEYQFEGVEDGIYDVYTNNDYGRNMSYNLVSYGNMVSSVYGADI